MGTTFSFLRKPFSTVSGLPYSFVQSSAAQGVPVVLHEMRPVRMTDAHKTGGLRDTVIDFDPFAQPPVGTGWTFSNFESGGLMHAIGTALIERRAVEVRGAEHYFEPHRILSCAAMPILGVALPPAQGIFQLGLVTAALVLLGLPLGRFMAAVYAGRPTPLTRLLGPLERGICRLVGADPADEMPWDRYAAATIAFSIVSFLATYALQRMQHLLPLNPAGLPGVSADSSLNTAVSFMTNTN
ncbi:MAG: potassium-transporting ATPase subunit KdpA, partial [Actinomycetota bacterium]